MMTTREAAEYLRIKERKLYDLVRMRRIPCTRVAGKWLFPKALIDLWLIRNTSAAPDLKSATRPTEMIVGSHDPLLEWAARESGCELAVLLGGSLDGLRRFAEGKATVCGLHVFDSGAGEYNVTAVRDTLSGLDVVLLEWAWREQGLILPASNPRGIAGLKDLARSKARFVDRQEEAGARILLSHLLEGEGLTFKDLTVVAPPALSEADVAVSVSEGKAEAGFGVQAVARQFRLDFVPLHRERYDLAVRRREYFESGVQRLLSFAHGPRCVEKAKELGGYDVAGLGRVVYNSP
ncbi:MAG: helix-turn-helix transcriptional regulator [Alphaproteobacteria bacterium]